MAWREITEADLLTVLSGPELEAYRTAALGDGQEDPTQSIIDLVTGMVRGYIAGWQSNKLAVVGLPVQLIPTALDLIAYRIPGRTGGKPEETRRDANVAALKLLERVSAGEFAVEQPAVESTELFAAPKPSFSDRHLHFSHRREDGI